jgi:hypothetical protein
MVTNAAGTAEPQVRRARGKFNPTENAVQRTRAYTGLLVVLSGDALIAGAAVSGIWKFGSDTGQTVAILSSAFTAIGTMTAAYFGIRAATNTAQSAVVQQAAQQPAVVIPTTGSVGPIVTGPSDGEPAGDGPTGDGPTAGGGAPEAEPAGLAPGDGGAPAAAEADATGAAAADDPAAMDRPLDEPDDATQEEQLGLLRDTGNDREDMTEDEEARLLEQEFGPADEHGVYGAPKGGE